MTITYAGKTGGFAAAIGVLAGACLLAAAPARAAEQREARFELSITRAAVPASQRVLRVRRGDHVRLRIVSDAPGEIHLHGYRQEALVAPGRAAELAFRAHATGRYRIEWHPAGEKPQSGHAHGPALATLEVRPE